MSQPKSSSFLGLDARGRRALVGLLVAAGFLFFARGVSTQRPARPRAARRPAQARKVVYTDIAYAYHGMLLDKNRKEIKLDKATVESILNSMLESLAARPDPPVGNVVEGKSVELLTLRPAIERAQVEQTLALPQLSEGERMLVKTALIQQGIDAARPGERNQYQWRFDLVREKALSRLDRDALGRRPRLNQLMSSPGLGEHLKQMMDVPEPTNDYIERCRAEGVPIPPDWPNEAWKSRGFLPFKYNFLQSGPDTEVFTYEPADGSGLCYALPRKEGQAISLLGIICQSKSTGKACFWDNKDAEGQTISGEGITLRIAEIQNGSNLVENCTRCHRGYNVFIVHPGTPLAAPASRDPDTRYTPIGQEAWSNPPPFEEAGTSSCSMCHELAEPTPDFCEILRSAADLTMPNMARPAGWETPRPSYSASISALRARCQEP